MIVERIGRNNSATFTGFLHRLDQCTDPHLNIHLIMDNGPSHTSKATRAWIDAHPRITVTYTPKHASWLDMAELWFSILTRALLRRGEFTSRADLAGKITDFAQDPASIANGLNRANGYRWWQVTCAFQPAAASERLGQAAQVAFGREESCSGQPSPRGPSASRGAWPGGGLWPGGFAAQVGSAAGQQQ